MDLKDIIILMVIIIAIFYIKYNHPTLFDKGEQAVDNVMEPVVGWTQDKITNINAGGEVNGEEDQSQSS